MIALEDDLYAVIHDPTDGRVICIGCCESHDWMALHIMAEWCRDSGMTNGRKIFTAISVDDLDHYNMGSRPEKGDAIDALRNSDDVLAVLALNLCGMDPTRQHDGDPKYCYNRENHNILIECILRHIPLFCWGEQPLPREKDAPDTMQRTHISDSPMLRVKLRHLNQFVGVTYPICLYERIG